jgi:S1-C subfamily serine protease
VTLSGVKIYLREFSSHALFTTARIESASPSGPSVGTGFFYDHGGFEIAGRFLVTARHVIEHATRCQFRLHKAKRDVDAYGQYVALVGESVQIGVQGSDWIFHPDAETDLAVLPLTSEFMASVPRDVFWIAVQSSYIFGQPTLERMAAAHPVIPHFPDAAQIRGGLSAIQLS